MRIGSAVDSGMCVNDQPLSGVWLPIYLNLKQLKTLFHLRTSRLYTPRNLEIIAITIITTGLILIISTTTNVALRQTTSSLGSGILKREVCRGFGYRPERGGAG